jgi:hypothetical protein
MKREGAWGEQTPQAERFLVVYPFMMQTLHLKGTELLVYARIFGFSKSGRVFFESRQRTADFLGVTKRSVQLAISNLEAKGLIVELDSPTHVRGHPKSYITSIGALNAASIDVSDVASPSVKTNAFETSDMQAFRGEEISSPDPFWDEKFAPQDSFSSENFSP